MLPLIPCLSQEFTEIISYGNPNPSPLPLQGASHKLFVSALVDLCKSNLCVELHIVLFSVCWANCYPLCLLCWSVYFIFVAQVSFLNIASQQWPYLFGSVEAYSFNRNIVFLMSRQADTFFALKLTLLWNRGVNL